MQWHGRAQSNLQTESEAIDFAVHGYTATDKEMSRDFKRVLNECRRLREQVSSLFVAVMSELMETPHGVGQDGKQPTSGAAGQFHSADADDDDDEDYSDEESESQMDD